MSEIERREGEEPEKPGEYAYLYLAISVGLLVASVMVILTAGVLVAGFPFVIGAAATFGLGISELRKQKDSLPEPANHERELLSAIRDNDGSITPTEAAMETSLTVKEADAMLSELARGGHLKVESRDGTLFYRLPSKETENSRATEIE